MIQMFSLTEYCFPILVSQNKETIFSALTKAYFFKCHCTQEEAILKTELRGNYCITMTSPHFFPAE